MIRFTVYGQPQSAGSKRAFVPINKKTGQPFRRKNGNGVVVSVVDDNSKSRWWKQLVALAAQEHRPPAPLEGPIALTLTFVRVRPGGHFNKGKKTAGTLNGEGQSKPSPIAKPDVLKLARAVEDALTGIMWHDDAQICDERIVKRWGDAACVEIEVTRLAAATVAS